MGIEPKPAECSVEALRELLTRQINQIVDPCSIATALPAGIVDLRLLRSLDIDQLPDGRLRVAVKICVTHPFCAMSAVFLHEVEKCLKAFEVIEHLDVCLDQSTFWTESFMSSAYKSRLAEERARKAAK